MRILILTLGNGRLCGDDAAGPLVFAALHERVLPDTVVLFDGRTSGLDLLAPLSEGYDVLIVVDAYRSGKPPGMVTRMEVQDFTPAPDAQTSIHDLDFPSTWQLARSCGYALPKKIVVFGIEPRTIQQGVVAISDEVAAAVPEVTAMVIAECERVLSKN